MISHYCTFDRSVKSAQFRSWLAMATNTPRAEELRMKFDRCIADIMEDLKDAPVSGMTAVDG